MEEYATKVVQVPRDIRPGSHGRRDQSPLHTGVAEIAEAGAWLHGRQTASDGSIDSAPHGFFPVSLCNERLFLGLGGDNLVLNLVVCGARKDALGDELIFVGVGATVDDALRICIANAGESLELVGGSCIDVDLPGRCCGRRRLGWGLRECWECRKEQEYCEGDGT